MKYLIVLLLLTGCNLSPVGNIEPTRPTVILPSQTPAPTVPPSTTSSLPSGSFDALPVMQGICFEAAWDAAEQVFILSSAEEHIRFYDLVDNARLCRQLVERLPFDFSAGTVLAGLWNRGTGCTASHTISAFERDDSAKTIRIVAIFATAGDCPYELVRGFWLGIQNAGDYQITIEAN